MILWIAISAPFQLLFCVLDHMLETTTSTRNQKLWLWKQKQTRTMLNFSGANVLKSRKFFSIMHDKCCHQSVDDFTHALCISLVGLTKPSPASTLKTKQTNSSNQCAKLKLCTEMWFGWNWVKCRPAATASSLKPALKESSPKRSSDIVVESRQIELNQVDLTWVYPKSTAKEFSFHSISSRLVFNYPFRSTAITTFIAFGHFFIHI